jgi:cathepsin L
MAGSMSFRDFVAVFGRDYVEGSEEYEARRALYEERAAAVREHNRRPGRNWHAAINHFSDHTEAEFSMYRGRRGYGGPSRSSGSSLLQAREGKVNSFSSCAPAQEQNEKDWSHLQSLQSVRNQGGGGCCWAVATSVLLQTRYEIAHGKNDRTFSAQELVECTPNEHQCGGTGGCGGATMELALQYVEQNGVREEDSWPYTASSRSGASCTGSAGSADQSSFLLRGYSAGHGNGLGRNLVGLRSWQKLEENKQEPLRRALLEEGPVGISAAAGAWSNYGGGIFDGCKADTVVDHAVVAIGFGEERKKGSDKVNKFWKIRNSWGQNWGEHGNIRIKRLETDIGPEGHCGVDNQPKEGTACKPYPKTVDVCGMCGILYDSVKVDFDAH